MKLLFKTTIKETGGRVAWLTTRGSKQVLELNWYPKRYGHGGKSGLDHLAFEVKDASDAYRKLVKREERAMSPFKEGRWLLAYVKDPDGNWIELGSRLRKMTKSWPSELWRPASLRSFLCQFSFAKGLSAARSEGVIASCNLPTTCSQ